MPLIAVILAIANVFKTLPTAVVASSGAVAGGAILLERPPTSTLDWVIVVAGAIGMVGNVLHANLASTRSSGNEQQPTSNNAERKDT